MSTLPKGWKEEKLSELVDKIIDYRGKTPKKLGLDWSEKGKYKALSAKSVKTGGLVNEDQINLGDEELYKAWMKDEVEYNDILLTSEAPMGEVIIWKSEEKIILSQRLFAIRVKENISPDYMYYYFISKTFQSELLARSSGTTVVGIKQTELLKTNVILPESPNEQKEIASILSSFDKKIELLKEQNQTLETMAQTIFKEWFVDFNYPNATNEMIDSEMGEIPKGWRIGKIGELASLKSGYAFKSEEFVEESIYKVLKIKDLKGNGKVSLANLNSVNKNVIHNDRVKYFQLSEGDIVLAMSGNTTGKIGVIPNLDVPLYLNQRVGKFFLVHQKYKNFLYIFLMYNNYENKILSMGYGSAQPNISPSQIENIKLILPSEDIYEIFAEIVNPLFEKLFNNLFQIQTLEETRDSLLPKLMSGQKRVFEYDN